MFNNKYSNFLTVILVIAIIGIVALIGYLGYNLYMKYYIDKNAEEAVAQFEGQIKNIIDDEGANPGDIEGLDTTTNLSSSSNDTYQGFKVVGVIEIPAINVKYPVLEKVTKRSIEVAVAILYGPGLNKQGNTLIVGHNYRNGLFFSNLKKLANNDNVYITDSSGNKVKYTIYNVYQTTAEDTAYITRDVGERREISLSTCTDDGKLRTIVWATAD